MSEPGGTPDPEAADAPEPTVAATGRVRVTTSVIEAMQAVQDAVRHHPWAVAADLDRRPLRRVIEKLRERLPDLDRNRHYAVRRRRAGEASHVLVAYWPPVRGHTGFFVLLSSDPDDGSREPYRDVRERDGRLVLRSGWWELVRYTASGAAAPRWTWTMSAAREQRLIRQIDKAVAQRDRESDKWLADLGVAASRWPGFHGVRQAHRRLGRRLEERWRRVRKSGEKPPAWRRLPYARKRARAIDHAHETGGDRRRRALAAAALKGPDDVPR